MTDIRVLVVDDQALIRSGLRLILESEPGLAVIGEGGDGREAVEMAQRLRPDVILMDVRMPVMDGIEATKLVRTGKVEHVPQGIPIIALTAHAMAEHRKIFLEAGMDDYIAKPVEVASLETVLGRVIGKGDDDGG